MRTSTPLTNEQTSTKSYEDSACLAYGWTGGKIHKAVCGSFLSDSTNCIFTDTVG